MHEWRGSRTGVKFNDFRPPRAEDLGYRAEFVGGCGITRRTLSQLYGEVPALYDILNTKPSGKVIFLGNGFSLAPLELLSKPGNSLKPVLVDMFDYDGLRGDIEDLLSDPDLDPDYVLVPSFLEVYRIANEIENQRIRGTLQVVKYFVGAGNPPTEICNARLVVNCFGPSLNSLKEQVSLLEPGGELLYSGLDGVKYIRKPRY